jgi:hypothetical protein
LSRRCPSALHRLPLFIRHLWFIVSSRFLIIALSPSLGVQRVDLCSPVAGHRFRPSFQAIVQAIVSSASSTGPQHQCQARVVALLNTRGPLFLSSSVVHRFVRVCPSSSRPPLLELVSPSSRFRPPLLATGYVVHLKFVASSTTVERHSYHLCSRHLSTLAAVDYSSFVRVFISCFYRPSPRTCSHIVQHFRPFICASFAGRRFVKCARRCLTHDCWSWFSAVNRFRPPLLATGLVVHLQFVASLTAVNRHFEPFGFVIVLHLLS